MGVITCFCNGKIFISRCIQNNIPINQIQNMTGHKKLYMIMHYLDLFGVDNNGIASKLEIVKR
jgi:hypothetical protein